MPLPNLGRLCLGPLIGADNDGGDERSRLALTDKRGASTGVHTPPIATLEQPGPFDMIVEELVKRLDFDADEVAESDADVLCARVSQVCNELAVLNNLPALNQDEQPNAIDPKYNCSDPDALIWKLAHGVFGVDPLADFNHEAPAHRKPPLTKMEGDTWRDSFRALCKAFGPPDQMLYEVREGEWAGWTVYSLWGELYMASSDERGIAVSHEEKRRFRDRAKIAWRQKFGGMRAASGAVSWQDFRKGEADREWMRYYPDDAVLRTFQREVRNPNIARHEWIDRLVTTVTRAYEQVAHVHDRTNDQRVLWTDKGKPGWSSTDSEQLNTKQQIVAFQRELCRLGNLFYTMKRQTMKFNTSAARNPFVARWRLANPGQEDSDSEPGTPADVKREYTLPYAGLETHKEREALENHIPPPPEEYRPNVV